MATYEPPRVGSVPADTPLPEYLWPVGTRVVLGSGRNAEIGEVDHYEFYHLTQTTFPVKTTGGYVTICSAKTASKANDDWVIDVSATVQQLRVVRQRQSREELGLPASPKPSSRRAS